MKRATPGTRAPARDDPASCIDAPTPDVWIDRTKERVQARLAELGSCAKTVKKAGGIEVVLNFRNDGFVESVQIPHATLEDCRALECVRRGLASVSAPARPPDDAGALTLKTSIVLLSPPAAAAGSVAPITLEDDTSLADKTTSCLTQTDLAAEGAAHRLPPEEIQSRVRQHYGRFRQCYEGGLARNPQLRGRVAIRFVIDRKGHVAQASIFENGLPDCAAARCVRDEMRAAEFPVLEGNDVVTVVYPVNFEPG